MRALLILLLLPGIALAQQQDNRSTLEKCRDNLAALDIVHVRTEEAQVILKVKQGYIELCQAMVKAEQELAKPKEEDKKEE